MAEGDAERAFLESMRAAQGAGPAASEVEDQGENGEQQIDSSDEYDPAQTLQDVSYSPPQPQVLPVDPASLSRPVSTMSTTAAAAPPAAPISSPPPSAIHQTSASIPQLDGTSAMVTVSPPAKAAEVQTTQVAAAAPQQNVTTPSAAVPKTRLPHDIIGILEDRIAEDEKGDLDAWMKLIDEYKGRGKLEDVRKVYGRFFGVFPSAADEWVSYVKLETEAGNRQRVEQMFQKTLGQLVSLPLWSAYLNHIRRYYNITVDKSTKASQVNHAAYEAVLEAVGIDKEAGTLWQDYIQFIKSGPGIVGGTTWQDGQKMDLLRKAYQRAIAVPHQAIEVIWKEYSQFERGLNKQTAQKYLQDKSPEYMTARVCYHELQGITRDLHRTTLPSLPPAPGYQGDVEYVQQVEAWKRWIEYEKSDQLVLKEENFKAYSQRVIYVYKQALMALRFWPETWFDAADFCFKNDLEKQASDFLTQGIAANPESALLAYRLGDHLELSSTNGNDDDSKASRGVKVREPYDKVLDKLYDILAKTQAHEAKDVAAIEARYVDLTNGNANGVKTDDDDGDDHEEEPVDGPEQQKSAELNAVQTQHKMQIDLVQKTLSQAWIAMMRAFQRMQGSGRPGAKIGGSRQIFADARKRGRITSEVYAAAAMLEYHTGDAEAARKIYERGMKLFPEDDAFALEYIKLLTSINDHTNARVVFETTVTKLQSSPTTTPKAKPLYAFFHSFESRYGELNQTIKLEERMRRLFPSDPALSSFSSRYTDGAGFSPTSVRPIISFGSQARPKPLPGTAVGEASPPTSVQGFRSPPGRFMPPAIISSPKRPLPMEIGGDLEAMERAKKVPRSDSPLKGAAGRRLNQLNANRGTPLPDGNMNNNSSNSVGGMGGGLGHGMPAPPPPLPTYVSFLLSVIPNAAAYADSTRFTPEAMVALLRNVEMPARIEDFRAMRVSRGQPPEPGYHGR